MSDGSLWDRLRAALGFHNALLSGPTGALPLCALLEGSCLAGRREELSGASVLIATRGQLEAALAMIELDGIARRLVLLPPDLKPEHLRSLAVEAEVDAVVCDPQTSDQELFDGAKIVECDSRRLMPRPEGRTAGQSEWILLTSGTTGLPKMAQHTLQSLTGAIAPNSKPREPLVWSTFYDIRRYGGLQIFLRSMIGGSSMVLAERDEPTADFLVRAGAAGVTHISGTPSHWRNALMSPQVHRINPRYIRLSGEIVDQAILDKLRSSFPSATIVHAFASTEAGVAFEVRDGRSGFPANLLENAPKTGAQDDIELLIEDGSLRIRSSRMATRYLGDRDGSIADARGFIDTRDMVEFRDGRYYFAGRRDGVINVGGLKVHPEEIEAVINRHPRVQSSLVRARRSPITGSLIIAEVVLKPAAGENDANNVGETGALKQELLADCRQALAAYKVPATIRIVPELALTTAGKLVRH